LYRKITKTKNIFMVFRKNLARAKFRISSSLLATKCPRAKIVGAAAKRGKKSAHADSPRAMRGNAADARAASPRKMNAGAEKIFR
jgi:hypothetical protein